MTMTALVMPALTNFTILDVAHGSCDYKQERIEDVRRNKGVLNDNEVLIKYKVIINYHNYEHVFFIDRIQL